MKRKVYRTLNPDVACHSSRPGQQFLPFQLDRRDSYEDYRNTRKYFVTVFHREWNRWN